MTDMEKYRKTSYDILIRKLEREMKTRKAAEKLLEEKSRELYDANEALRVQLARIKKQQLLLIQSDKMASLGTMASGIAHEINSPLQFIATSGTFLLEAFEDIQSEIEKYESFFNGAESTDIDEFRETMLSLKEKIDHDFLIEEIPQSVKRVTKGVQRISDIIKALKGFAHPGLDNKKHADIHRTIEDILLISANQWKNDLVIEKHYDERVKGVKCYENQLKQVFLNLVSNAAYAVKQYNKANGRDRGTITITTEPIEEGVRIMLADTGGGIPDAIKDRVFDLFFTTKDIGEGTGQGLAISYNVIVEKHQGKLYFDTVPDVSTTFTIELPLE